MVIWAALEHRSDTSDLTFLKDLSGWSFEITVDWPPWTWIHSSPAKGTLILDLESCLTYASFLSLCTVPASHSTAVVGPSQASNIPAPEVAPSLHNHRLWGFFSFFLFFPSLFLFFPCWIVSPWVGLNTVIYFSGGMCGLVRVGCVFIVNICSFLKQICIENVLRQVLKYVLGIWQSTRHISFLF